MASSSPAVHRTIDQEQPQVVKNHSIKQITQEHLQVIEKHPIKQIMHEPPHTTATHVFTNCSVNRVTQEHSQIMENLSIQQVTQRYPYTAATQAIDHHSNKQNTEVQMISWESLPNEVWMEILRRLGFEDLKEARLVCQFFSNIGIRFLDYNKIYLAPCPHAIKVLGQIAKRHTICWKARTFIYDDTLFQYEVKMKKLSAHQAVSYLEEKIHTENEGPISSFATRKHRRLLHSQEYTILHLKVHEALCNLLPLFPNLNCLHVIGKVEPFSSYVASSYRNSCGTTKVVPAPWPSCFIAEAYKTPYSFEWDHRGVEQLFRALAASKSKIKVVKFGGFDNGDKITHAIPLTPAFQTMSRGICQEFFNNITCLDFNLDHSCRQLIPSEDFDPLIHWGKCLRGVGNLLKAAKGLTSLTFGGSLLQEVDWETVFDEVTWPRLVSLKLDHMRIKIYDLVGLLRRHLDLENFELSNLELARPGEWADFMTTIDPGLHLKTVTFERLYFTIVHFPGGTQLIVCLNPSEMSRHFQLLNSGLFI